MLNFAGLHQAMDRLVFIVPYVTRPDMDLFAFLLQA
jgi:hypothetical protein